MRNAVKLVAGSAFLIGAYFLQPGPATPPEPLLVDRGIHLDGSTWERFPVLFGQTGTAGLPAELTVFLTYRDCPPFAEMTEGLVALTQESGTDLTTVISGPNVNGIKRSFSWIEAPPVVLADTSNWAWGQQGLVRTPAILRSLGDGTYDVAYPTIATKAQEIVDQLYLSDTNP